MKKSIVIIFGILFLLISSYLQVNGQISNGFNIAMGQGGNAQDNINNTANNAPINIINNKRHRGRINRYY
jgi:hypothetical protein